MPNAAPAKASAAPQVPLRDLEIKYRAVDGLVPFARNARTHSDAQIDQIAASMREFGWTNPVLIDPKGVIIAGHGRVLAANKLSIKSVPTITLHGLTSAQRRAYVLADNKLSLNAGWDTDLLKLELGDLQADGFNLALIGFDAFEIADIFATRDGNTDPDDAPALQDKAVSKTGDTWLLGPHRLHCGDSTKADDVTQCLKGATPMLMVTDPPYGVDYDANWRNLAARTSKGMGNRAIGAGAIGKVKNDDRKDWTDAWRLFSGDVAYAWHASYHIAEVQRSLEAAGFEMRCHIIWAKNHLVIGRGHYHWQHEPCWYAVRTGKTARWAGDRKQSSLWTIDKQQKSETGHSTQKPVECMARPIKNHTKGGEFVYEPFSGSGTTVIACEMLGRRALAIEISPQYVDMAVRRWEQFTGQKARLEYTGDTFATTETQRAKPVKGPKPKGAPKRKAA